MKNIFGSLGVGGYPPDARIKSDHFQDPELLLSYHPKVLSDCLNSKPHRYRVNIYEEHFC